MPCSYLAELLAHMGERALGGATSDLYHNAPREVRGSPLRHDASKVSRQHRMRRSPPLLFTALAVRAFAVSAVSEAAPAVYGTPQLQGKPALPLLFAGQWGVLSRSFIAQLPAGQHIASRASHRQCRLKRVLSRPTTSSTLCRSLCSFTQTALRHARNAEAFAVAGYLSLMSDVLAASACATCLQGCRLSDNAVSGRKRDELSGGAFDQVRQ